MHRAAFFNVTVECLWDLWKLTDLPSGISSNFAQKGNLDSNSVGNYLSFRFQKKVGIQGRPTNGELTTLPTVFCNSSYKYRN